MRRMPRQDVEGACLPPQRLTPTRTAKRFAPAGPQPSVECPPFRTHRRYGSFRLSTGGPMSTRDGWLVPAMLLTAAISAPISGQHSRQRVIVVFHDDVSL